MSNRLPSKSLLTERQRIGTSETPEEWDRPRRILFGFASESGDSIKEEYYIGFHWGTFRRSCRSAGEGGLRRDFAVQQTQSIGDESKVFVARDGNKQCGTTLVKLGETWNWYQVCYRPLYGSESDAQVAAKQWPTPPRRPRLGLATSNGRARQSWSRTLPTEPAVSAAPEEKAPREGGASVILFFLVYGFVARLNQRAFLSPLVEANVPLFTANVHVIRLCIAARTRRTGRGASVGATPTGNSDIG
jgi:hypothetical protein